MLTPTARAVSYASPLQGLAVALVAVLTLAGCSDDFFQEAEIDASLPVATDFTQTIQAPGEAPRSADRPMLRHPQLMDRATSPLKSTRQAREARAFAPARLESDAVTDGPEVALAEPTVVSHSSVGDEQTHLFLGFHEYEADGVTPRILDQWGITQRVLQEYGVTRRVLQEYGVTRRVLQEYGITSRVLQEYGGVTMDVLRAYGITSRVLQEYGVTESQLQQEFDTRSSVIRLRLRVSLARPGISVSFGSGLLDTLLLEFQDDPDLEFAEPDPEMQGGNFFLREGLFESGQMLPWNIARVGAAFTNFDAQGNVHAFILDSGIYDRDLNVVEAKDFTMLFVNRDQETWDDSEFEQMPVFDPEAQGDPSDATGHGTHIAGTVGASNNDEGTLGMAPGVKLHSLKVLTDQGRTDVTTVVAAVDYVTDYKRRNPGHAVVMNLSLGMDIGTTAYNALDEAIKRATEQGVVAVVSAGNDGADASTYSPAHVAEAITVGAYDQENRFASFSNYGPSVDLLAPGDLVVSLTHLPEEASAGESILMSGTSMATPHAVGAAALYLHQHPNATPLAVKAALLGYSREGVHGVPANTTTRTLHVGDFASTADQEPFLFTGAWWNRTDNALVLSGRGPRLDQVSFYDDETDALIGSVVIMEDGQFSLNLSGANQTSCRVRAVYEGFTYESRSVVLPAIGVPGCSILGSIGTTIENAPELSVEIVAWTEGALYVWGTSRNWSQVRVLNATTMEELGTTTPFFGSYTVHVEGLSEAPCEVVVTQGDITIERTVINAPPSCEKPISITGALWDGLAHELTVAGLATGGTAVSLVNPDNGVLLASASAGPVGSYGILLRPEMNALPPCRLRAVDATGVSDEIALNVDCDPNFVYVERTEEPAGGSGAGMPGTGGSGTGESETGGGGENPFGAVIEITRAKWNSSKSRLIVKGNGTPGETVELRHAVTGAFVGTKRVKDDGTWKITVNGLSTVPCSVEAVSGSASATEDVRSAPADCSAGTPADVPEVSSFVEITSAKWNSSKSRLIVKGNGTPGETVELRHAVTGAFVGTKRVKDDGTWKITVNGLSTVPCSVEAVSGSASVAEAVRRAPSDCS
ncbi:MAG: S8 family peptidase [Bacteroidota bacterium]